MKNKMYIPLSILMFLVLSCTDKNSEQKFVDELIDALKSPDPTQFASTYWPTEKEFYEIYSGVEINVKNSKTGEITDGVKSKWEDLKPQKHKVFALLMKQSVDWQEVKVDSISTIYRKYNRMSPSKEYIQNEAMIFEMKLKYHRKQVKCEVTIDGFRTKTGKFKIVKTKQRSCDEPY